MFEKVLFATDFSEYAKKILEYIADFPGARDIILLHVVEEIHSPRGGGEIGAALYRNGNTLLKEEKRHLENLGKHLKVTTIVKASSDPAGAIIETAEKKDVSLIVVGARGGSLVEGVLLGSVSHAVLRRSKNNVLIIRHKLIEEMAGKTYEKFSPMILDKVLCPIDFSRFSDSAIALLGQTNGVKEIILLHVVSRGETESEINVSVKKAEEQLETFRVNLEGKGIQVKAIVKTGNPTDEIIRTADEEHASVIWMSSHGKGWFRELLVGSTTGTVAMNAKHPIIIVHKP